jgi:hypothetical protein
MTRTTMSSEKRKSKRINKEDFIDILRWGEKQRHGGAYPAGINYKRGEETSSPPQKATAARPPLYSATGWG